MKSNNSSKDTLYGIASIFEECRISYVFLHSYYTVYKALFNTLKNQNQFERRSSDER